MAESIPAPGPFDTAAMQIAQARAHANEEAFLREIAKTNDESNAHALDEVDTAPPTQSFFSAALPDTDPQADPAADPTTLALFSIFGEEGVSSDNKLKAQQLHDSAVLQKDMALLEEAANENSPLPLGDGASTVDLSPQAQDIISGLSADALSLTPAQLAQLGDIIQPVADEPLTPALLQHIQSQLAANGQNPVALSLHTLTLAMNFIASMQPSSHHQVGHIVPKVNHQIVAPVAAIDKVAVEDSAIR